MGTIQHSTIVVTTDKESAALVFAKAVELGCVAIGPSSPQMNQYTTVCVVPDGSKELWADSDAGDERRESMRTWLRHQDYDWVEVSFGELGTHVVDGSRIEP